MNREIVTPPAGLTRRRGAVVAVLLWTASVSADGPQVRFQGVDDATHQVGVLSALSDDGVTVRLPSNENRRIARADLWWMEPVAIAATNKSPSVATTTGDRAVATDNAIELLLTGRDRLLVREVELRDDVLSATRSEQAPSWTIPVERLDAILFPAGRRQQLTSRLLRSPFADDTLLLVNGDRLTGELLDIRDGRCRVRTSVVERDVPLEQIAAVAFSDELSLAPKPAIQHVAIELADGSLLRTSQVAGVDDSLHVTGPDGLGGTLAWSEVARLDFSGDRVTPLTTLPWQLQSRPYLSRTDFLSLDRNVAGGPLRLRSDSGGWGFGVSTATRLTFDLRGDYRAFHALAGIDQQAENGGNAAISVVADGRALFESPPVQGGHAPIEIGPLDLRGVKQLVLQADFGEQGDILDLIDWRRPTLLK